MIQAQLDDIREKAAAVVVQYSNGLVDAMLGGSKDVGDIFDHCLRLHYLWGVLKNARLSGGDLYVGDTLLSGASMGQVYHKIWHYSGIFANVDLSDYSAITVDDGDEGTTDTTGGDTEVVLASDHYRAGTIAVSSGSGTVTFYKNGVASPLASTDYTLDVSVITDSGYEQTNIVIANKYKSGFTYSDVLEGGTLRYFAVLET